MAICISGHKIYKGRKLVSNFIINRIRETEHVVLDIDKALHIENEVIKIYKAIDWTYDLSQ